MPEQRSSPEIGRDEWVARRDALIDRGAGLRGRAVQRWRSVPITARSSAFLVACAVFPLVVSSDYVVRVGVNTLIYALLALGLNVVVGWAGLLDLGYVAFFGFGGYLYAMLSSGQLNVHLESLVTIPIVIVSSAALGILIGIPSRRLLGDYLAILTLFFAQAFVVLVSNADRITPPWRSTAVDFTGGPNGIAGVDNLHIGSLAVQSVRGYFYVALVALAVVIAGLSSLNRSRIGRAWRSLREDPLAAELMGIPVRPLKLLAFAFGAGIAGFTGTVFVSLQAGVFPANFDLSLLILIYAMVILGGAGSITGAVLGAITINVVLEILRTPNPARFIFYGFMVAALLAWMRPYKRLAIVAVSTVIFGLAARAIGTAVAPTAFHGSPPGGGWLGRLTDHWVLLPTSPSTVGNVGYAVLLLTLGMLTQLRGAWRTTLLVPTLYLAAFVWENKLVTNPSVARLIVLGILLIAVMNARPQGLLGTSRIEIT